MPFSGSAPNQTYSRSDGTRTGAAVCAQEKAAALNDTAALADLRENDLATAINSLWLRNGGNQPSADLPMNSHKFTGMADGSARGDSVNLGQIQDGNLFYAEAAGTANAIALSTTPSFAASEGVMAIFVAEVDSTGAVTVDFNGDGAVALQVGGSACIGGEINNGQAHIIIHDGTQWQLVNPARLLDLMALAKTDGNIIVGDGTNWVAESGATARTSLGLGTGDSPQFTGIELGHASDTTITRASAGNMAIEGNLVYRADGTDVPVADGGSGRSTATAYAVICGGATTTGAHQSIASVGTSGQVLTSNGAGNLPTMQDLPAGLTLATAQASTSGSALDFTSLPAGIKRITVMFSGVSLSSADNILVQLGDSGGLETTGYASGSAGADTSTAGFIVAINSASRVMAGHMLITRITGNSWVASGVINSVGGSAPSNLGGTKDLSGELDRVRVTTTGGSFDGGSINILYE